VLRPSEEFKRWNEFATGGLKPQADFALFLEENAADIWQPEPTEMLELARDLEAASGQTFKTRTRLDNGDSALVFESETKVTSRVQPPPRIHRAHPALSGRGTRGSAGPVPLARSWRRDRHGIHLAPRRIHAAGPVQPDRIRRRREYRLPGVFRPQQDPGLTPPRRGGAIAQVTPV